MKNLFSNYRGVQGAIEDTRQPIENDYSECSACGEVYDNSDLNQIDSERFICDDCMEEEEHECYECGDNFHVEQMTHYMKNWYCSEKCLNEHKQTLIRIAMRKKQYEEDVDYERIEVEEFYPDNN